MSNNPVNPVNPVKKSEGLNVGAHRLPIHALCVLAGLALVAALPAIADAPAATARTASTPATIGPVNFRGGTIIWVVSAGRMNLSHGVSVVSVSQQYQMTAESAVITLAAGSSGAGGKSTIAGITADGDPSAGKQVLCKFINAADGSDIQFLSDHAELDPDPARPGQDMVTFTGNVHMTGTSPSSLAAPATATMSRAVVFLGPKPDYPRIEGDDVDGAAMPKE